MPTTITKTIAATSSPTTPDYSTLQAWEDAITADLVAADELWEGQCLDQGTFTSALSVGGQTADATRYIHLTCGTGASFKDKAGVRTTALRYNSSNGVTIETSGVTITCATNFTRFTGLQAKRTAYSGAQVFSAGSIQNILTDSCIFHGTGLGMGNNPNNKSVNCLFEVTAGGMGPAGQALIAGATIVCPSADGAHGCQANYDAMIVKNCAVFGFASFCNGTPASGSNYNATDLASAETGANNVTSLTFADQFENSTNDFRAKSDGDLQAGTPDATNLPDDISGQDRDDTTPWIGCWEVAGGGAGLAPDLLRSNLLHSPLLGGLV